MLGDYVLSVMKRPLKKTVLCFRKKPLQGKRLFITKGESEILEMLRVFANHDQTERRNGSNEGRSIFGK